MSGSVENKAQGWVLALTSTASLMIALDVLVVATALDQIGKEFGAQVEALQWTINAYTLTFAVPLMTATVAGDRYGRRRIFIPGLLVFAVASAGCALATSIGSLIAARAVQGVGAAILMPWLWRRSRPPILQKGEPGRSASIAVSQRFRACSVRLSAEQ
jgi:MFS family permease